MKKEKYNEKKSFICVLIISILILLGFITLLIITTISNQYPDPSELKYENCTFVNYELYTSKSDEGYKKYYVYVEEYKEPLEIDKIVYHPNQEKKLSELKRGDKILVSIREYNGDLNLYSLQSVNDEILTYEYYLKEHKRNGNVGIIVSAILASFTVVVLIVEIVHYKKTGESISL